jgi:cyanate lyase
MSIMANRKRLFNEFGGRGGCVEMVLQDDVQLHVSHGNYTGRDNHYGQLYVQEECVSVLYIQATEQACLALRRAAQRIRGSIRKSDTVLLSKKSCVLLLPETPLTGAQAVARRLYPLLVDVEYELQVLYGSAARSLLQQVQGDHIVVSQKDMHVFEEQLSSTKKQGMSHVREDEPLPYLAFLANYPSQRLLHMFPYELANRYHCIPVGAERGVLTLATGQRLQEETVLYLREVTQRNIFQVRCEVGMIDDVLRHWQRAVAV